MTLDICVSYFCVKSSIWNWFRNLELHFSLSVYISLTPSVTHKALNVIVSYWMAWWLKNHLSMTGMLSAVAYVNIMMLPCTVFVVVNESPERLIYVLGLVKWKTAGITSRLTIINTSERQQPQKQASFNIQGSFTSPGNPSSGLNTRFQRYTRDFLPNTSLVSHTGNKSHEKQQSTLIRRSIRGGPNMDVFDTTVRPSFDSLMTHRSGTTVAISSSLSDTSVTTVASSVLHDRSGTTTVSQTSRKSGPSSSNTSSQSPSWPGSSTYQVVSSRAHKLTCELCAELTGGGRVLL